MNWQKLSAENRRFLFLFALFILVFYSMITYSSASTMYKSMNDSRVRHAGKMATSAADKEKGATANAKGEMNWWAKSYAAKLAENGEYVPVKVGTYIDSFESLSIKDSFWSTNFYIWFSWQGDRELNPGGSFFLVNGTITKKDLLEEVHDPDGMNYQRYRVSAKMIKFYDATRVPLEDHMLNLYVEDGVRDANKIRYVADSVSISPRAEIPGFKIVRLSDVVQAHSYKTAYGDPRAVAGSERVYSQYLAGIRISRDGIGSYIKIFLSLFAATLLTLFSFFIKPTDYGTRFAMPTGAYFGAVANSYVANGALPSYAGEFGLVDHITGIGLLTITLSIVLSLYSYHLAVRKSEPDLAIALDRVMFMVLGGSCLLANIIIPFCARA